MCVLVDAIDGSANFRMGLPLFCTAVAVFDGRTPRVGVLYDPHQNVLFCGMTSENEGKGTAYVWDVARGRRLDFASVFPPDDLRVLATHMPSTQREPALDTLRRLAEASLPSTDAPLFHRVAMLNSGQLALAYVASRSVTAFVNVATSTWNVAAGEAIIRSLGGRVTDDKGSRIEYSGSEITSVVASWSDDVHDAIIDLLDRS